MNAAVRSVAILQTLIEENRDVIECYVPFIGNLSLTHEYRTVDIHRIQSDFVKEYGLRLPYHPLVSILGRCRKFLRKSGTEYRFDVRQAQKYAFSAESSRATERISNFVSAFQEYTHSEFNREISQDEALSIVLLFLKSNDAEIVLSNDDPALIPSVTVAKTDQFIFHRFVQHAYDHDSNVCNFIIEMAVGYLYASAVLFPQFKTKSHPIKNVRLVLDTRLLLRLIGLEGSERKDAYELFVRSLKDGGARLRVFDHTIDEINGILDDCIRWVEDPAYNPEFAGPALKHFVENNYKSSDVMLFKAMLDSKLSSFGIREADGGYSQGCVSDFIDENKLYETIVHEYSEKSDHFEEWQKAAVLYRDVKSISAVTRMRNGSRPRELRDANTIFVTTNAGFARAVARFSNERQMHGVIPECMTDVTLGTMVWLNSPATITELQGARILADTIAALRPNETLISRYRRQLQKLFDNGDVTEKEYYYLRSHPTPIRRLEDKTLGDPHAFEDTLPEEILSEIKSKITDDIRSEANKEKEAADRQIDILTSELQDTVSRDKANISIIHSTKIRIARIARFITRLLAVLSSIVIGALIFYSNQIELLKPKPLQYILFIAMSVFDFINLVFGIKLCCYFNKLNEVIKRWLLRFMGFKDET